MAPARAARPAGARPRHAAGQDAPGRDRQPRGRGLRQQHVHLARGAWLCSSDGVAIDAKWGGLRNLAGGEGGVSYVTRKVTRGFVQTLKSGEGLVFEFSGPGRLWTQSRNPKELTGWLTAKLPFKRG
ncbi:AIM24 family protein [Streptomyces sp. V4-01]|uniref:AIM24 family protein n=1 Tax=Actinacidiphila polyblastidii TaxID=3110430 RepID=A0ABU7PIU0_9ACTN|nr:AIM24 family protein [Streptomyces sp. V4-01]